MPQHLKIFYYQPELFYDQPEIFYYQAPSSQCEPLRPVVDRRRLIFYYQPELF